jgi:beta-lactam-binding protein with PASTA domain
MAIIEAVTSIRSPEVSMNRLLLLCAVAAVLACAVAVPPAMSAYKKLPNVVGMNHQAAQNRLQSAGFYNLRERDCTGRGRLLLFDRNWKVKRMSPKAGARVSTKRAITLCSVKYTD